MANVNAKELRELQIPLPAKDFQEVLVGHLEDARAKRDRKIKEAESLITGLDALKIRHSQNRYTNLLLVKHSVLNDCA